MTRQTIDCREYPSDIACTVSVSADTEDELLKSAAFHAAQVHGHKDGPELRAQLSKLAKAVA